MAQIVEPLRWLDVRLLPTAPEGAEAMSSSRSRTGWRRRKAFLERWIRANGHWCPGWERPCHAAAKHDVDHVVPVAKGGRDSDGLAVLCASCNRSRGGKLGNQIKAAKADDKLMPTRNSRVW